MLGDMKAMKMLGLSMVYGDNISRLREIELETSGNFRKLLVWQMVICKPSFPLFECDSFSKRCLANAPAILAPFATLAVYAIIAVVQKDDTLLASHAFASISLIGIITYSLNVLCTALPSCMQGVACFGRIEKYLLRKPCLPSVPSESLGESISLENLPSATSKAVIITFEEADICWSAESHDAVLHKLSLTIRPGLTAIIGAVASGKSTLLATMIGETTLRSGSITPSLSGIAFCSQTPWIMNDTIRNNITGGHGFDQEWYEFSISCCALRGDIDRMPEGDQSIAGSNGVALSGGQKQRVVFQHSSIIALAVSRILG